MDVPPLTSSAGLAGLGSIASVDALLGSPLDSPFSTSATALSPFDGTSTVVTLSGVGQLLSAVSIFQSNLAALQPGSASSGGGRNFGGDFGSLAAEAQNFVDTFNGLQSSFNQLQGASGTPAGPFGQFIQFADALKQRAAATFDNGNSTLTRLADIGIDFQTPASTGKGSLLSIDMKALQSAFNSDAAGTFALLGQAVQSLGQAAAGFAGPADSLSATLGSLARIEATTSTLSLFGSLATGSGSQLPGLADLLLLESLSRGGGSQVQSLLALSQFSLVSSLLG